MSFAKALDPNSSLTCLMSCSFQAWAHHSQSNNPPQVPPMLAMQREIAMIQAWSKEGQSFCGKDPLPTFELAKATKYLLINLPNLPFSNVFKSKEVAITGQYLMLRIFLTHFSFMARLQDSDPFARSGRSPDWPGDVDYRPILNMQFARNFFSKSDFLKIHLQFETDGLNRPVGVYRVIVKWSTGCRTEMWSLKHVVSEHCQHPQGHSKYYVTTSEICPSDLLVIRTDRDKGRRTSQPQINCSVRVFFGCLGSLLISSWIF